MWNQARAICAALVLASVCVVVALGAASAQGAGIANVWAVNDGEKVKRDDLANPEREKNSVWDGRRLAIFGARNEVVAFQLILQAGAGGAKDVDVMLSELVRKPGGERLAWKSETPDPTDTRDRQIERFTEHYLNIEKPSPPGWFYNYDARPKGMGGWTPDALVPASAKQGKGGMPFHIAANLNQGVWFDVYVPGKTPAGTYSGNVVVSEGGKTVKEIPVTLTVFDFVLPDENHFHAMIYFEEDQVAARHGKDSAALVDSYHRLAHRHRVEFTNRYGPDSSQSAVERLSGVAFKPERGYVGPGEGVGYTIVPASFYGIGQNWQQDQAWATADAFMTWLTKVKPDAVTFLYIVDEPPRERLPWIKQVGDKHHANPGPGKKLPMYVTTQPRPELEGAIDVWCTVTNHYNVRRAAEEKAKGRRWWVYNGHRPYAGTQLNDAPAVDCRVTPWACWKYGVELWFYWHADHWRHNSQAPRGNQNVWADPVTFGHSGNFNGDGVLIYPGQDVLFAEEDRGVPGPVASIRLKNIRRGMQDYEYLWLASQSGLGKEARAIADVCVPAAFSDANGRASWSVKGSDWDAARLKLGKLIEAKRKGKE